MRGLLLTLTRRVRDAEGAIAYFDLTQTELNPVERGERLKDFLDTNRHIEDLIEQIRVQVAEELQG
jgi:hypothetical protein